MNENSRLIDDDRLFPADPATRAVARRLYASVKALPIICPHGHTDPRWYAENAPFPDPATLFVVPDHYVFRMLDSQGIDLSRARHPGTRAGEGRVRSRGRSGGSSRSTTTSSAARRAGMWLDHVFATLFGFKERLAGEVADRYYDTHRRGAADAGVPAARAVRALQHRGDRDDRQPLDPLAEHAAIRESGWKGRVRPDLSARSLWSIRITRLSRQTSMTLGTDHRLRHADAGAAISTRTGNGAPFQVDGRDGDRPRASRARRPPTSARPKRRRSSTRCVAGEADAEERELFRAQMLTEMARMSVEDGLVLQIHPGLVAQPLARRCSPRSGRDKGVRYPEAAPTMWRR